MDLHKILGIQFATMNTTCNATNEGRPGGASWRRDGNFHVGQYCERCGSIFYIHALANRGMTAGLDGWCPWCKGQCSAAELDRWNAAIEAT
jgi:hypothetical protein